VKLEWRAEASNMVNEGRDGRTRRTMDSEQIETIAGSYGQFDWRQQSTGIQFKGACKPQQAYHRDHSHRELLAKLVLELRPSGHGSN
jgi:hypothetical protein